MFSFSVKNVLSVRLIRIIALAAIFGFGMASCEQSASHNVPPAVSQDIAITLVDPDALSVDITLVPVADASQVTFTVSGNYHDYQWYLDGDKLDETSASLTLDKSVVGADPRHIIVIALDAGNTPYSGAVLFQFN
jgi:hypothetical protein